MIKEIITYPTQQSVEYGVDVRLFNDELLSLVEDLKETIVVNNLDALAAFQIGSYYNVIVVKKEDGEFLELINPRIINQKGRLTTEESTAYYPGLHAMVTRYDEISVVFQDIKGENTSIKAKGEFSILLQRKIDYLFGSSFVNKLSKEEKKVFEQKLEGGENIENIDSCPTMFFRDKIFKVANLLKIVMLFVLLSTFLMEDVTRLNNMWHYQLYLAASVIGVDIIYFLYAYYEIKKDTSCSSCQIGNIFANVMVSFVKLSVLVALSYFLIEHS